MPKLPTSMRRILRSAPGPQCTTALINNLTALIIKLDQKTINGFRGSIPIGYRAEAGLYPTGAIIRLVLDIHDRPETPFQMDTFLNPASDSDSRLLERLCTQDVIEIHFFEDTKIRYIFSKRIRHREQSRVEISAMIADSLAHNAGLTSIDFLTAKEVMMKDRPL